MVHFWVPLVSRGMGAFKQTVSQGNLGFGCLLYGKVSIVSSLVGNTRHCSKERISRKDGALGSSKRGLSSPSQPPVSFGRGPSMLP